MVLTLFAAISSSHPLHKNESSSSAKDHGTTNVRPQRYIIQRTYRGTQGKFGITLESKKVIPKRAEFVRKRCKEIHDTIAFQE